MKKKAEEGFSKYYEQWMRDLEKSRYDTRDAIFEKWLLENAEMIKEMSVACRNKH